MNDNAITGAPSRGALEISRDAIRPKKHDGSGVPRSISSSISIPDNLIIVIRVYILKLSLISRLSVGLEIRSSDSDESLNPDRLDEHII